MQAIHYEVLIVWYRKYKDNIWYGVCVLSDVQASMDNVRSSSELCTDLGIKDVDLEWSDADYQNLITFSIFARMVRPQLMAVSIILMRFCYITT